MPPLATGARTAATACLVWGMLLLPAAAGPRVGEPYEDGALERTARERLERDPVLRRLELRVAVRAGVARLEGQVESLAQAEEARRAVAQVRGLVDLQTDISISRGTMGDEDLRRDLLRALERYPALEGRPVDLRVEQGVAILGGSVRTAGERRLVLEAARGVPGVRGVELRIVPQDGADAGDDRLESQIRGLLADRVRFPIQGRVQVRVRDRMAILEGTVQRVIDRIEAEEVAWFAPGVRRVQNLITVVPRPRLRRAGTAGADPEEPPQAGPALREDPETPDSEPAREPDDGSP